jgi:protein-S-isoprenylcysteine O-methyltransferase Ste14
MASRLSYLAPLMLAGVLLTGRLHVPLLGQRFIPAADWTHAVAAIVMAAGLLFSVWARRHLGTNWSASVTIKQDHELVTSGPYRIVRHPIYTGLLIAFAGLAISIGEWRGVLALALAGYSFWRKLRLEERWMMERFGAAYQAYSHRTPALIPFLV